LIRETYPGLIIVIWLCKCGSSTRYYSKSNFPLSKKTSVVSRSYGMLSGTWPMDSIHREDLATVSPDGPNICMLVG